MDPRLNEDGVRPDESVSPPITSTVNSHKAPSTTNYSTQTTLHTQRQGSDVFQTHFPLPTWGDTLTARTQHCRILYQNVNGISSRGGFMEALELGDRAQSLGVNILCMSETNVDWRHKQNGFECSQVFRKFWNETVINQSSSTERFNTTYQPGGTMTIVGDPWSGRSIKHQCDVPLGRWSEIEIQGRRNRKIMTITAYRPVKNSISRAGPVTTYAQQWHILNRNTSSHRDPCQQMLVDLGQRISHLQNSGYGIILSIDANDSLHNATNAFSKWVRDLNLCDTHVHRHGVAGEPATHARGSTRIDYIFTSHDLTDHIVAAGILPLMFFHQSDHRSLFVDIDLTSYLRGQLETGHRFGNKCLVSTDPRAVAKYREALTDGITTLDITTRLIQLTNQINLDGFTNVHITELNFLESQFTEVRLSAEKKCRHIRTIPWSPALKQAQRQLRFWRMSLSAWKNGINFDAAKQQIWAEGCILHPSPTYRTIQSELRRAQRHLHDVGLNAKALRLAHLESRADAMVFEGRTAKAKAIQIIIRAEAMRDVNKKLSRVFGKNNKSGLSHLLVDDGQGGHECIDDPADIHRRLLHRNKSHFSQAEGTPFTTDPITTAFGPHGTNHNASLLLNGQFDINSLGVSDATKCILRHLKRVIPSGQIQCAITPLDVRRGKAVWRETTSVSPSGLHLGHDKAVLRQESSLPPPADTEHLSEQVFWLQSQFINLALQHCHVYERWKKVVNATIEKIPGTPLIEKLRVIHIIESDFNLTFGILFGRRMMATAEASGELGHEQFGSRAEKTSLTPLLAKYCKFAISRLAHSNMASFDNDAKSCYDRIVMLLASLCSQRLGMDKRACNLFLKTLDATKYHVKTKHGISDEFYTSDAQSRIHGPGQGGRASPGIWAIISCLLMDCIQEKAEGIEVVSPDLMEIIVFFTTGFVDDVTLWIGDMIRSIGKREPPLLLLRELQQSAQWWEQLLYATGGKLELSKCFYYLIHWSFNEEGEAIMSTETAPSDLTLTDSATGEPMVITHRPSNQAHKTLGIMINPSGDTKDETARIMKKARDLGRIIGAVNLSPYEAQLALNTRIYPAITYGLAVGTLTEQQAHKIQGLFIRPSIRSMGFNCHTPCAVVYAPSAMGGVACKHVFSEQGRLQVSLLLQQIRMRSDTGHLAVAFFKWAQLVSGMPKPIMEEPSVLIPHLAQDPYLNALRKFLDISKLGIHIPSITHFRPKRKHDATIMEIATNRRPRLSKRTLERINRCRIYLRAESMADISTADGLHICHHAAQCTPIGRIHHDGLWPKQSRPGPLHRHTWSWFLNELCKYKCNRRTLLQPLGNWTVLPTIKETWDLYYDDTHDQVYAWFQETWRVGVITMKTAANWDILITGDTVSTEELESFKHRIPLSYHYLGDNMATATPPTSNSDSWTQQHHLPVPRTWRAFVNSLPSNRRDLLRHCHESALTGMDRSLVEILHDAAATIMVVSSCAVEQVRGAYAWIMTTASHTLWSGHGNARGSPMTTRRANAYGKLAWLQFLQSYATFYAIPIRCKILHYCDDKVLNKHTTFSQQLTRTWEVQMPDFDAVSAVSALQLALLSVAPKLAEGRFVKGNCSIPGKRSLNHIEIVKAQAEIVARTTLTRVPNTARPSPTIPWETAHVYLLSRKQPATSNEPYTLRWQWREDEFKQYLCGRWNLSKSHIELIDWQSLAATRSSLSSNHKVFATKLMIGWLATGSHLTKFTDTPPECMKCGELESTDHLLRCHHDCDDWADWLHRFQLYLSTLNTAPTIITSLLYGVSQWLHEHWELPLQTETTSPAFYVNASQTTIGWGLLMRGILTQEWTSQQLSYLQSTAPSCGHRQALSWSKRVSMWLIQEAHKRWTDRNNLVHSKSDIQSGHISQAETIAATQVRRLYKDGKHADSVTLSMLSAPQEEVLRRPLRSLQHWINSTAVTARKRASAVSKQIERTHRDIRSYWRTPTPTSPLPPASHTLPSPCPAPIITPASQATTTRQHVVTIPPRRLQATTRRRNPKTKPVSSLAPASKATKKQPTLWKFGWIATPKPTVSTGHIHPISATQDINTESPHTWTSQRIERDGGGSQSKVGRIRKAFA